MALITCEECGAQISDKATSCPSCGCPMEPKKDYNFNVDGMVFDMEKICQKCDDRIQAITMLRQLNKNTSLESATNAVDRYLDMSHYVFTKKEPIKKEKSKKKPDSVLSIFAGLFAFLTCTSLIGFILAIIDLVRCSKKDDGKSHNLSAFAIGWFVFVFLVSCALFTGTDAEKEEKTKTQIVSESVESVDTEINVEENNIESNNIYAEEEKEVLENGYLYITKEDLNKYHENIKGCKFYTVITVDDVKSDVGIQSNIGDGFMMSTFIPRKEYNVSEGDTIAIAGNVGSYDSYGGIGKSITFEDCIFLQSEKMPKNMIMMFLMKRY